MPVTLYYLYSWIIEAEHIRGIYIYINGYWVFNGPEPWYLTIYYFADSNNYVTP